MGLLAEQACALTGRRNPVFLNTLAAAYAEAGRFPEAIRTAQEALSRARTAGNEALVLRTEALLDRFRANQPCRETGGWPQ